MGVSPTGFCNLTVGGVGKGGWGRVGEGLGEGWGQGLGGGWGEVREGLGRLGFLYFKTPLAKPHYCRDQNHSGCGKMFPGINQFLKFY